MAVELDAGPISRGGGRSPRSRAFILAAAALTLLVVGSGAGLWLGGRSSSSVPVGGAVDVGFAQDMSVHHENAVTMATWAHDRSADPVVRQLAYDIESGQTAQIGRMQGWLGLWGAAPYAVGGYMRWMPQDDMTAMGHSSDGQAAMPGMASSSDLARLRAANGRELDVLFLQLMLRHHQGGAAMLRYAGENATQAEVRNLAAQMLSAQTAESQTMQTMLAIRGARPLD